jgi:hypothetical protein
MTKRPQGPSLYFATDKSIFDALTNRKVDVATLRSLFEDRNIVVSSKTTRDNLASYFCRLNHDFYDHQRIAARLGVVPRREKITSMEVAGNVEIDLLEAAVSKLKSDREALGDVVQITRDGSNMTVMIEYDTVDYTRTEFSQVQRRDGTVEFLKSTTGYTVRSTQNEFVSAARDELLGSIEKATSSPLIKTVVSMFDIPGAKTRSRFFVSLMDELPEFKRIDTLAVYVYKPRPDEQSASDQGDDINNDGETHVERISMRGVGVSRSDMLRELTEDGYYITKAQWTTSQILSTGSVFEIDAGFEDPRDCTGFSFILSGVYAVEAGAVSSKKRQPNSGESDTISRAVDSHSRQLVAKLRQETIGAVHGGS